MSNNDTIPADTANLNPNPADTAWTLVCTALVLLQVIIKYIKETLN